MQVVGIFGVPGTGKSTLMRRLMLRLGGPPPYKVFKQGTATGHLFETGPTMIFGLYGQADVYGGTDRMSMSCHADVRTSMNRWRQRQPAGNVLFEGDRLASRAFLHTLLEDGHSLRLFYLRAPQELRLARFAERGSAQAERFLAGRDTKVRNLYREFPGPWLPSEQYEDIERNAERVLLEGLGIKMQKGA